MKDNPVAKNAHKFNKASVQKDRKKALKKGDRKHKGQRYEDSGDIEERSTLDAISSVLKRNKDRGKYQAALKAVKSGKYKLPKAAQVFDVSPKVLQDLVAEGNMKEAKNTPGDGNPCWDTHKKVGTKKKNGKTVNDCVPKNEENIEEKAFPSRQIHKAMGIALDMGSKDREGAIKKIEKIARGLSKDPMVTSIFDNPTSSVKLNREARAPLFTFAVYNKDGKLHGATTDEKEAKSMAFRIKGEFKKLDKPMKQTDIDKKIAMGEGTSAQSRLDRAMAKRGLGKTNKAASDYEAKLMKKYGAKDLDDLKKKMGIKEGLQELTKRDMEMMSKRKDANLVKRGKKKAEPKVKNSSAGRTTAKVGEDDHIIMQLRQAQDLNGRMDIEVAKGKKTKLPKAMIDKLLKTHDKLRSNNDKKKFMIMLKHELRKKAGVKSTLKLPDETPPPRSYQPSRSYNDRDAASKLGRGRIRAPGKKDRDDGPTDKELRNKR